MDSETANNSEATATDEKRKNTVFIGRKPTMSYVLAVLTQFSSGTNEVRIKARGRSITTAVDVAEVVRNRFIQGVNVKEVGISTEEIKADSGEKINLSAIEIILTKNLI